MQTLGSDDDALDLNRSLSQGFAELEVSGSSDMLRSATSQPDETTGGEDS